MHMWHMQDLMYARGGHDAATRWARCMCELAKHAAVLCHPACQAAYAEICARLQVGACCMCAAYRLP